MTRLDSAIFQRFDWSMICSSLRYPYSVQVFLACLLRNSFACALVASWWLIFSWQSTFLSSTSTVIFLFSSTLIHFAKQQLYRSLDLSVDLSASLEPMHAQEDLLNRHTLLASFPCLRLPSTILKSLLKALSGQNLSALWCFLLRQVEALRLCNLHSLLRERHPLASTHWRVSGAGPNQISAIGRAFCITGKAFCLGIRLDREFHPPGNPTYACRRRTSSAVASCPTS